MELDEAGSTDEGMFGLEALSAAFWGWVKEVIRVAGSQGRPSSQLHCPI